MSSSEPVFAPEELTDLSARTIEEIRALRDRGEKAEVAISYVRRVAQGRVDIAAGELRRRVAASEPGDVAGLVEQLPEILSRQVQSAGPGRLPTHMVPADDLSAEVDAIVEPGRLSSLPSMTDDEIGQIVEPLKAFESAVSAHRRRLHEQIDSLQAELVRRYKSGEASVDSLLG